MLAQLQRTVSYARCLVSTFDPSLVSGLEARAAVEAFVQLERLASAGKTLAAGRLDESGVGSGDDVHRDLEGWLAAISGTTIGAATGALGTARRVTQLPATAHALRAGELSAIQVDAVSAAAKVDPTAEQNLLDTAKTAGVKGLKAECECPRRGGIAGE